MWEIEKLYTNKKILDLQLAFFYIQAIVGSIKFTDQIFFTNFSHKSVFRVDFFIRTELQVTNTHCTNITNVSDPVFGKKKRIRGLIQRT